VVNCADAGWVSELTLLARQVQTALGEALGEPSPPLRFVVGNVDAPEVGDLPAAAPQPSPLEPSADDRRQAHELAAGIADPALRAAAERAIAAGLARRS